MDFNKIKKEIKEWSLPFAKEQNIKFLFKEEINFENINTLTIDIEDTEGLGLIIIYEDKNLFFDYIKKSDIDMKTINWSEKYTDINDIKVKICIYFQDYWK